MREVLPHFINVVGTNLATIENMERIEHQFDIGLADVLHEHDGVVAAIDKITVEGRGLDHKLDADARGASCDFAKSLEAPLPSLALGRAKDDPAGDVEQRLAAPVREKLSQLLIVFDGEPAFLGNRRGHVVTWAAAERRQHARQFEITVLEHLPDVFTPLLA